MIAPESAGDDVRRALSLTAQSSARERTADITTTGRRTGEPRRIETWLYRAGDDIFLSGRPGRRAWLANLRADPDFTLHLKHGVTADLPARAEVIDDEAERRRLVVAMFDALGRDHADVDAWVAGAPIVRVRWR